jgi:hypothetical protein
LHQRFIGSQLLLRGFERQGLGAAERSILRKCLSEARVESHKLPVGVGEALAKRRFTRSIVAFGRQRAGSDYGLVELLPLRRQVLLLTD